MSRSWAERVRVGLAPERVELVRFGLLGGPGRQTSVACRREPGQAPWQAAVDTLDGALAGFAKRGDALAAVLSNHWVRYLVLPWQAEIGNARELADLAQLRFAQVYGETAGDWTVRCSPGGYGEASVACAVDTALVGALRERLAARGLRLASVQPLLMAAYNGLRRDLAASKAFVTLEPGRLCLGLMQAGQWSEIVSRRAAGDPAEALETELATLAPDAQPERLDVLLIGDDAHWPETAARPVRLLRRAPRNGASLALCGAA